MRICALLCPLVYPCAMRQLWYGHDGKPIDMNEAMHLFANPWNQVVMITEITAGERKVRVSTVHLILDQSFMESGPVLWETMAFEGVRVELLGRYTSLDAAIAGHAREAATAQAFLALDGAETTTIEHVNGPANLRHVEALTQPSGVAVDAAEDGDEEEREHERHG